MKNLNNDTQSSILISSIKTIGRKSKGSDIKKCLQIPELEFIQEFLHCNREEAFFFALICFLSVADDPPKIVDIARHLELEPMELISKIKVFHSLQRKGFVRKNQHYRDKGITGLQYYVPSNIFEAISNGDPTDFTFSPITDSASLFSRIVKLSKMVEDEVLSHEEYSEELVYLIKDNSEHYTSRNLVKCRLSHNNTAILLTIGSEYIKGTEDIDLGEVLTLVFGESVEKFRFTRELIKGTNLLVKRGLVRLEAGIFKSDRYVSLTEKGLGALFDWDTAPINPISNDKTIIDPNSLRKRTLYFNPREESQLVQIKRFLLKSSYRKIIREMERNNLPSGIAILFHGAPGTGKTEAVYQLARVLKKKIMNVDISQTKNLFFGESEKLIKEVFDKYRQLNKNNQNAPILLFNEADGVLGKRKDVTASNVAQTENAIQNIILQEMENLNGIMIATTNLTNNLDKAFERRFLYNVRFEEPNTEIQAKIWKEHLPALSPSDARILAESFPFSGGHIANVGRKVIANRIIHQQHLSLEQIKALCGEEKLDTGRRNIGFQSRMIIRE